MYVCMLYADKITSYFDDDDYLPHKYGTVTVDAVINLSLSKLNFSTLHDSDQWHHSVKEREEKRKSFDEEKNAQTHTENELRAA